MNGIINFLENLFHDLQSVSNSLNKDQDRYSVGPELGPNCCVGDQQTTLVGRVKVYYGHFN